MESENKCKLESYRQLEILSKSGIWEIDIKTNKLIWSEGMHDIYEIDYNVTDVDLSELINDMIFPSDIDEVNEKLNHSIKTGEKYEIQHRILFPDGRVKYVEGKAKCIKNEDDEVIRMIGVAQDITEKKELEILLKSQNIELKDKVIQLEHRVSLHDLKKNIDRLKNKCE